MTILIHRFCGALRVVSTKTFEAMSCPSASFEPLTATCTGPLSGATLTMHRLVPGVNPMSRSLWRVLCSPLMKETLPCSPSLRLVIETRFCRLFPISSKPFLWVSMHSAQVVNCRSQGGMVFSSSGHLSGCLRRRHKDSSASSDSACSSSHACVCTLSLRIFSTSLRNLSSSRCFRVIFSAVWRPFLVRVLPW